MTCRTPGCTDRVAIKKSGLCKRCYGIAWRAAHPGYMRNYGRTGATLTNTQQPQQPQLPFLHTRGDQ